MLNLSLVSKLVGLKVWGFSFFFFDQQIRVKKLNMVPGRQKQASARRVDLER